MRYQRREVPLIPAIMAMLKRHKATQAAERLRAGDQWQDCGLVFTTELGGPVEPRNLLRVIETAAKRAGIEDTGVHTPRHSAAVTWLEAGVHIKRCRTCWGTAQLRSRATPTGTPATARPARRSNRSANGSGCDRRENRRGGANKLMLEVLEGNYLRLLYDREPFDLLPLADYSWPIALAMGSKRIIIKMTWFEGEEPQEQTQTVSF
jgi:hypothetical protein